MLTWHRTAGVHARVAGSTTAGAGAVWHAGESGGEDAGERFGLPSRRRRRPARMSRATGLARNEPVAKVCVRPLSTPARTAANRARRAQALDTIDDATLSLARLIRASPWARLLFLAYLLILHIWVFYILAFHTHSMDAHPSAAAGSVPVLRSPPGAMTRSVAPGQPPSS